MTAPTWDDIITASTEGQAAGYDTGWAHGYAQGYEAAQRDLHERDAYAQIARGGVDAIDIAQARQKAAARTGQSPAERWSA